MSEKLANSFRVGLDLPLESSVELLEYRAIPEWDSIGHMALIATLESDFEVEFSPDEILGLSSYAIAKEIIESK
jgi:acyl carrier protein